MKALFSTLAPMFLIMIAVAFLEGGITAEYADAKSMKGGRMFKTTPSYKKAPASTPKQTTSQKQGGGFSRGLMGGLLGGALGGLLFGSMFGAGGSGMGILPLLLLAAAAYFLFKKFSRPPGQTGQAGGYGGPYQRSGPQQGQQDMFGGNNAPGGQDSQAATPDIGSNLLDDGLDQIRATDPGFDSEYFKEVASDVFFQVQAGWMRRDIDSYRHLLGDQLAKEYTDHFEEMRRKGHINKLESIAVRNVEVVQAGSDGKEDFLTVLFTASLLDYTVDDSTGDVIEGSNTSPVKFEEEWTWARPVGTQEWKLEGIK